MSDQVEQQRSYILVQFEAVASTVFRMNVENVTPLQMLAIAAYLEVRGKNALLQSENERQEREVSQQLSVPKPEILVPGR